MKSAFPEFLSSKGCNLSTHFVEPDAVSRAGILLIHGMGDHSRSLPYQNFYEFSVDKGFTVFAFDLRGHGESEGRRMYIESWDDYLKDVDVFVSNISSRFDKPLFLVGLSMGGLIAINYALNHSNRIDGVVAVAPALSADGASPIVRKAMKAISRIAPKLSLPSGLDLSEITRDAYAASVYTSDPLLQTKVTARLGAEVISAIDQVQARAGDVEVPTLIVHGEADRISPINGSERFIANSTRTIDYQKIEGAFHNLFIETNKDQVLRSISDWIGEQID